MAAQHPDQARPADEQRARQYERTWLWAAGGLLLLSVVFTSLGPVLFLPLFYKLQRIEDAQLTERLTRVAEREGARVLGVYRMGMSAKTRKANAMVAGLGKTQRII